MESFEEFRAKGIGSSDIAIIMGMSPFKTPHELWLEKTGKKEPFTGNWATQRGQDLEPSIRNWYNKTHDCECVPDRIVSKEYNFIRANCDGIDVFKNKLIEIKAGNFEDHINCVLNSVVPEKYFPQLQYLMYCFEFVEIDYVSFNDKDKSVDEYAVVTVKRDKKFIDKMVKAATDFWDMIKNNRPPKLTDEDKITIEDLEVYDIAESIHRNTSIIKELKEQIQNDKNKLTKTLTHPKVTCFNFDISIGRTTRVKHNGGEPPPMPSHGVTKTKRFLTTREV